MKTIVTLSGGLDSTTLLYWLLDGGAEVRAISFNYGQRHKRELEAAAKVTELACVEHRIIDMSSIKCLLAGSSQTDDSVPVPHGHYTAPTMAKTVVPNRNSIMLNIAAAWAIALKYDAIATAIHAGDHEIYFDCRPEFARSLQETIQLADEHKVRVETPFVNLTKTDIANIAKELKVPVDLTYSCYEGEEDHCGQCGTCTERKESLLGWDPTKYKK